MEDLESSAKKNSVKIFSQFLKFSVFRAQFSGSHFGNSQFRSEIETHIGFVQCSPQVSKRPGLGNKTSYMLKLRPHTA